MTVLLPIMPKPCDHENYSKARTLATFEHLGLTFRVVRRRFDGRHWRGYLALLFENTPMSHDDFKEGDATVAAAEWKARAERTFPPGSEERLKAIVTEMVDRYTVPS